MYSFPPPPPLSKSLDVYRSMIQNYLYIDFALSYILSCSFVCFMFIFSNSIEILVHEKIDASAHENKKIKEEIGNLLSAVKTRPNFRPLSDAEEHPMETKRMIPDSKSSYSTLSFHTSTSLQRLSSSSNTGASVDTSTSSRVSATDLSGYKDILERFQNKNKPGRLQESDFDGVSRSLFETEHHFSERWKRLMSGTEDRSETSVECHSYEDLLSRLQSRGFQ